MSVERQVHWGQGAFLSPQHLQAQDDHASYMHLHHSVTWVLSTKEAMWDELLVRVQQRDETLRKYGWMDEDYNEQSSRAKFEAAVELYTR